MTDCWQGHTARTFSTAASNTPARVMDHMRASAAFAASPSPGPTLSAEKPLAVRPILRRSRRGIRKKHLDSRPNAIRGRQILSQQSFGSVRDRVDTIRSRTGRVHGTKIGGAVM